jgi:hypothetical protein
MISEVLKLSKQITLIPVVHGSGDFAVEIRRFMLEHSFDALAVPLPPSFKEPVLESIAHLPRPLMVLQKPINAFSAVESYDSYSSSDYDSDPEYQGDEWEGSPIPNSYVPIDPCQPVIAALRVAAGDRIPCHFVDLETEHFQPEATRLPDPYAIKTSSLESFAAWVMPLVDQPQHQQTLDRVQTMSRELHDLQKRYESILMVCSFTEWIALRKAFHELKTNPPSEPIMDDAIDEPIVFQPSINTLTFMLDELPFITGLYERARDQLQDDNHLTIDGVKELLIDARTNYKKDFKTRARKISPQMFKNYLKYVRNLCLIDRRFSPELYTLIIAAQQIAGDAFARHVLEVAKSYPHQMNTAYPNITLSIEKARLPEGNIVDTVSRLPGVPKIWMDCRLRKDPDPDEQEEYAGNWNPYSQCSWPPEDHLIEQFRTHVADRAAAIAGMDFVQSEKFTTSVRDGIDIRETMRNWHTNDLYVKVIPPTTGDLDCVVMLFETPADPKTYPWRTTWFAENQNESTLCFYATDYEKEMIGPGIAVANYGGAMFLFPPRSIYDIWQDPRLNFATTLEERLLAAGCLHAKSKQIALLSPEPPTATLRRIAKQYNKQLVHVPLNQFSASKISQLRTVHVLNGHQVRSYAAKFIRKS